MKKQTVKVTTYCTKEFDSLLPWDGRNTLSKFIDWLQKKRQEIPEKYRAAAEFRISSGMEYDMHFAKIEVFYYREETDAEQHNRESREAAYIEIRKAQLEAELSRLRNG